MKKRRKVPFIFVFIFLLIMLSGSSYLIYELAKLKSIEDFLRMSGSVLLGIICLILFLIALRLRNKCKTIKLTIVLILMLLIGASSAFAGYNVDKVMDALSKVSDTTGYKTYSSSLVTISSSEASSVDDIKDEKLGIIDDDTSVEGYEIPKEVIEEKKLTNEIKEYSTYIEMIDSLYKGEIKFIFLPTNYTVMFGSMEGYEDIKNKTKIIFTEKKTKKESKAVNNKNKSITEPFTILLMGVDSEEEEIRGSSFNGDSLMLITFNPKALSSTILSIPRDSYVPITCFNGNKKNKITHAAWNGESCMIDTIENFLDVDIDYYVKINFKGVVKLVDNLGGVEIDVPYNLCEQNSSRQWGANTVYIEKGLQTLDGEQALAYSRNRHPNPEMCSAKWTNYNSSDFVRGQHQQEVVAALLNKFKEVKSLDVVYKLLDTISSNMTTNMPTEQILSLYNVFKDVASKSTTGNMADVLGIQRLELNGYDARIVDYGRTNLSLYNYVLYDESVKAVSDAMKENLGLKKSKTIKSFSFDVNNPYEKEVIGANITGSAKLVLVPNFTGKLVSDAQSWGSKNGVTIIVNGGNGYVLSQNVPAGSNVEDIKTITITLEGTTDNTKKKTKDDDECNYPNMTYDKKTKTCLCDEGYEKDKKTGKCVKETVKTLDDEEENESDEKEEETIEDKKE